MLKIKDNVDLKELEKFGFTTSKKVKDKYNFDTKLVKAVFKSEDDYIAEIMRGIRIVEEQELGSMQNHYIITFINEVNLKGD